MSRLGLGLVRGAKKRKQLQNNWHARLMAERRRRPALLDLKMLYELRLGVNPRVVLGFWEQDGQTSHTLMR